MNEQTIADQIKQRLPKLPPPAQPEVAPVLTDEQSSIVEDAVSELALLRLAGELGISHPDPTSQDQLKFIYEQLASVSPSNSHEAILATLKDFMTRLGLTYTPDRFMRLYLWLKLNQERVAIEKEMANVRQPSA